MLIIGPDNLHPVSCPLLVQIMSINVKPKVRNLGVLSNSNLTFEKHTNKVIQSCYLRNHLRN